MKMPRITIYFFPSPYAKDHEKLDVYKISIEFMDIAELVNVNEHEHVHEHEKHL